MYAPRLNTETFCLPLRLRVLMLVLCVAASAQAQLDPNVSPAQIRQHNIKSIYVYLYNTDATGAKAGKGELESKFLYDKDGLLTEKHLHLNKTKHSRTVFYERKKGKLTMESHVNPERTINDYNFSAHNKAGQPTKVRIYDGSARLEGTEQRTYLADTLLKEVELLNDQKHPVRKTTYTYSPGTHLLLRVEEDRAGYMRKVEENTYNPDRRIKTHTAYDLTGQPEFITQYTYDDAGRLTRKHTQHPDGSTHMDNFYTWDEQGRLLEEYIKYQGIDLRDSRTHTYDDRGLHSTTLAFEATTQHWRLIEFEYTFY